MVWWRLLSLQPPVAAFARCPARPRSSSSLQTIPQRRLGRHRGIHEQPFLKRRVLRVGINESARCAAATAFSKEHWRCGPCIALLTHHTHRRHPLVQSCYMPGGAKCWGQCTLAGKRPIKVLPPPPITKKDSPLFYSITRDLLVPKRGCFDRPPLFWGIAWC